MDLQPNKTDAILKPITNTRISASEWNQLVGSCMAFINEAGFTPDSTDNEQFLNAFKKIAEDLGAIGADTSLSNLTDAGDIVAANASMPSATYDDLTLGASGSTYTAPANGYFAIYAQTSGTNFQIRMLNDTAGYCVSQRTQSQYCDFILPIQKGHVMSLSYDGTLTI